MSAIRDSFDSENLSRAWLWVRTNPDAAYKAYFRDSYTRFAVAEQACLKELRRRLQRHLYEPSHSTKIHFPKASGILRPYSLLTVEDQIAYQALVNVIAERLSPRVRTRYSREVFGHLYAGKASTWFYRKWTEGYRQFNEAVRTAVGDGLTYTADFDLTACYDSLDHGVLKHFLHQMGCEQEFSDLLAKWLSIWTATDCRIYQNHGIPQGPLASGMVSEVVLQHFDRHHHRSPKLKYFRYVDDIKLFASNEAILRRALVTLDMLSKDIGLFPQAAKIQIHKVEDIESELKSISRPPEGSVRRTRVNQSKLQKRLVVLSPSYRVTNVTRFKFLLAHAKPTYKLNDRLWRVFENQPHLLLNIAGYFSKYKRLPRRVADRIIKELRKPPLYESVRAALIDLACDRFPPGLERRMDLIVRAAWSEPVLPADVKVASGRWAIGRGLFSRRQLERGLRSADWYVRRAFVDMLTPENMGSAVLQRINNELIKDEIGDVSMAAAARLVASRLRIEVAPGVMHVQGAMILRAFGRIRRAGTRRSAIERYLVRLLEPMPSHRLKWRQVFGSDHDQAESQCLWCLALSKTDISAFVNALDVFNDLLLIALYRHDRSLGHYTPGNVGSVLQSTRLSAKHPVLLKYLRDVHSKRLESMLSHARVRSTGRRTNRIRYSYLQRVRPLMRNALRELSIKW